MAGEKGRGLSYLADHRTTNRCPQLNNVLFLKCLNNVCLEVIIEVPKSNIFIPQIRALYHP